LETVKGVSLQARALSQKQPTRSTHVRATYILLTPHSASLESSTCV
jgi:hypothetical protein